MNIQITETWYPLTPENIETCLKMDKLEKSTDPGDNEIAKETGLAVCEKTLKVLEFCIPYYEYVGIRTPTPSNYYSNNWRLDFSIFGEPFGVKDRKDWDKPEIYNSCKHNDWPAIWRAVEAAGLRSSCGNHHQYQIGDALSTGLYKNINGLWHKRVLYEHSVE